MKFIAKDLSEKKKNQKKIKLRKPETQFNTVKVEHGTRNIKMFFSPFF